MAEKKIQYVAQEAHTTMLDALALLYPESERDYMKALFAQRLAEHFGDRWKDKKHCINCGSLMRQYSFTPTKIACRTLRKLGDYVRSQMAEGKSFTEANKIHIPSLKTLTHNESDACTILRYLGFTAKLKDGDNQISGMWVVTSWGWAFLRGEAMPAEVTIWRKKIVSRSERTITMREALAEEAEGYEELHYTYSQHEGALV